MWCGKRFVSVRKILLAHKILHCKEKSKKNHNIPKETEQLFPHFWKTNLRMATLSKIPTLAMVTTADDPP
jgi:hypothetical protein